MGGGFGVMILCFPKETHSGERRVVVTPETVGKLLQLGFEVRIGAGAGEAAGFSDAVYEAAGARVVTEAKALFGSAGAILRVHPTPAGELEALPEGVLHVSRLDPFRERALTEAMAAAGLTALSMDMIPRSTVAQKMDALSSQSSLAGYAAVVLAAEKLNRIFPMMMTPSGTLSPARVFILGAGVAGLQAIATARRLGARVEAFDTRPAVEEQVQSLGARFVKVDLGETGQTAQGYAKALTEEQLAKQRGVMAKHVAQADVVITTAQVFGRPAPRIITAEMLRAMRPGSVVVDMAAATGGNVEGSEAGQEKRIGGVLLLGASDLANRVAFHASQMLANNYLSLLVHLWDKEAGAFRFNADDEVLRASLITRGGRIVNETVLQRLSS